MKALVYEGPRIMNMREVEVPVPGKGELLIKVEAAGICGSELGGYLGHNSLRKPPLVMGHEFTGTVAVVGEGKRPIFRAGDRVTVNPLVSCMHCDRCREGEAHLCSGRKLLGAGIPGAYAEYVLVPARNTYPLPDEVSFIEGAFTEPFACAIHVCRLLNLKPQDRLLIVGAGPIGLFTLQAALGYGLHHIAVLDINEARLEIAKELGAVTATRLENLRADFVNSEQPLFDAAVDAVGMTVTRNQCMNAVRAGGKVVFSGLHEADSSLPINYAIRNELILMGAFAYSPEDFELALQWVTRQRVNLLPWTEIAPLSEGAACFAKLLDHPGKVAKIMLQVADG